MQFSPLSTNTTSSYINTNSSSTTAMQIEARHLWRCTDQEIEQFIEDLCLAATCPGDVVLTTPTYQKQVSPAFNVDASTETLEAIFRAPLKSIHFFYEKVLDSKWDMLPREARLCLADAVLNNPTHFPSTMVEHADRYFLEMTFPIRGFKTSDKWLAEFLFSRKLPPSNRDRMNLLQSFYSLMFVENKLSSATNFSQTDAVRCFSFIARHIETCGLMLVKPSLVKHGFDSLLARYFKGRDIVFFQYEGAPDWEPFIAMSLSYNPNLTRIVYTNPNSTGSYIETLRDNSTIEALSLDCRNYDIDKFKSLISVLNTISALKKLELDGYWQDGGMKELVTALRSNSSIESLGLIFQKKHLLSPQSNPFIYLTDYLKGNPPLKSLSLAHRFCDDDINALVTAMSANTQLGKLEVACEKILEKQLANLFTFLPNNSTLSILSIRTENFSLNGLVSLARNLDDNDALKHLELHADVSNLDITALLYAVIRHPYMRALTIGRIQLGALITLIERSSLTRLYITGVVATDAGKTLSPIDCRRLLNAIKQNKTLMKIEMKHVLNKDEKKEVQTYLNRNTQSFILHQAGNRVHSLVAGS